MRSAYNAQRQVAGFAVMSVKKQLQNLPLVQALANKTYRKWKAAIGYARLRRRVANPPVNLVIGAAGVFGEGWIGTDIGYRYRLFESVESNTLGKGFQKEHHRCNSGGTRMGTSEHRGWIDSGPALF
jgi:hypothetical protein